VPLFEFRENPEALEWWERIDDVVMGGLSTSALRDKGVWSGIIRTAGGGFAGTRTKRLTEPIDLSLWEGVYVDGRLKSDADVDRRAWKCTLRCTKDAGEVVYSCDWQPSRGRPANRSFLPFKDFRLVRGPRFVAGAPPLSRDLLRQVYGLGFTISKFDRNGTVMDNFRDGFFRVDLNEIGVYGEFWPRLTVPPPVLLPPPSDANPSRPNSANSNNVLLKALAPVSRFVFNEKARRRGRARQLLKDSKKVDSLFEARLYGQKVIKRGVKNMPPALARTQGFTELARDAIASILVFPLRLLFRLIFTTLRLIKRITKKWHRPRKDPMIDDPKTA